MDQENPFLDAGAKYDAVYSDAMKNLSDLFEGLGQGKNEDGEPVAEAQDQEDIGQMF